MKGNKGIVIALIAAVAAIICITIMSVSLVSYKKTGGGEGITATGSASYDFEADVIAWRGSHTAYGATTKEAYDIIKKNSEIIRKYLLDNGVTEEEMLFGSVSISQRWRTEYTEDGKEIGNYLDGYDLYQSVSISSTDVDKVDTISRDITALIAADVEFISEAPEYYYTKLDELKLQLIDEATRNAKERIDILAAGSGGKVGNLKNANLGVFQITAQNSDSEEYSYGGTFNTSSRYKTASITVKLNYSVK